MATTLCSHNSALFNVRSRLKTKIGGGWGEVCCASSVPLLVFPPSQSSFPQSTLPLSILPQCVHSHKRLINGWFVAILKYMYSQVDASQNSV